MQIEITGYEPEQYKPVAERAARHFAGLSGYRSVKVEIEPSGDDGFLEFHCTGKGGHIAESYLYDIRLDKLHHV